MYAPLVLFIYYCSTFTNANQIKITTKAYLAQNVAYKNNNRQYEKSCELENALLKIQFGFGLDLQ
jgi:hypothetical protein